MTVDTDNISKHSYSTQHTLPTDYGMRRWAV